MENEAKPEKVEAAALKRHTSPSFSSLFLSSTRPCTALLPQLYAENPLQALKTRILRSPFDPESLPHTLLGRFSPLYRFCLLPKCINLPHIQLLPLPPLSRPETRFKIFWNEFSYLKLHFRYLSEYSKNLPPKASFSAYFNDYNESFGPIHGFSRHWKYVGSKGRMKKTSFVSSSFANKLWTESLSSSVPIKLPESLSYLSIR